MELEIQRHERINAPLQLVWEEMDSLEQILAKSPQISEYDVVPGGQRARGKTKLAWGPVKWTVDVEVEITEFEPRQRLGFAIEGPSLEVRYEGTIDLAPIGEGETKLEYRGRLDVRQSLRRFLAFHLSRLNQFRLLVRIERRRIAFPSPNELSVAIPIELGLLLATVACARL